VFPRAIFVSCLLLALGCASGGVSPAGEDASAGSKEVQGEPSPAPGAGAQDVPPAGDAVPEAAGTKGGSEEESADGGGGGAEKLPPLSDEERDIGVTFQPLADQFGFTRYVSASRTATGGIVFEYLPEDESLDGWRYLGRLLLTRVADTWEEGAEILPRYAEAFVGQMRTVNEAVIWPFPEGHVAFVNYEVGTGMLHEHNLATIWQVLPGHIAVFQAQRRPELFTQWQVEHFKSVAQRLGRADGETAEPAPPGSAAPGE
jgi:hypothetical protein